MLAVVHDHALGQQVLPERGHILVDRLHFVLDELRSLHDHESLGVFVAARLDSLRVDGQELSRASLSS